MVKIKRLALTLGEPAGIGVDICCQLAQQPSESEIVVVGAPTLILERAKALDLKIELYDFDPNAPRQANGRGRLAIVPIALNTACTPGVLNVANSDYVLKTLRQGFELCANHDCDALVTGPVHKGIISQSGIAFSGHTGFLQELAKVPSVLMSFYTPKLIVGLATTHCPVKEISHLLTTQRLEQALTLLHQGLIKIFKKNQPRITVCGLNPHAGEAGLLGKEEQTTITPVIQALQQKGIALHGPVPGDTAFAPQNRAQTDAILAMYHDQGLAPIKALYFGEIVNVTLGLPFLRTSVDHGTALDLAGTGKANASSLLKAIQLASQLS